MPSLEKDPRHTFRDFEMDQVSSSGKHKVRKADVRALLTEWWQALIALAADAGGIELPNLMISWIITGGDENDVVATPSLEPPDSPAVALFSIVFEEENTGAVTINGKPLLTNTAQEIPAGFLKAGMAALFMDLGEAYRLMSYGDAEAIQAAVEILYGQVLDQVAIAGDEADRAEAAATAAENATMLAISPDVFTGNGVDTDFTLSGEPQGEGNVFVTVGGVPQASDGTSYTIVGTTLSFAVAPPDGARVEARIFATNAAFPRLASTADIDAGTNNTRAVTPAGLEHRLQTFEVAAATFLADKSEVEATDFSTASEGHTIVISRWSSASLFAPSIYAKVGSEPSHDGKVQALDGSWFELSEHEVYPSMFGPIGTGADRAAINRALAYAAAKSGVKVRITEATYTYESGTPVTIPSNTAIEIDGGTRIVNTVTGTNTGLFTIAGGTSNVWITGLGQLVGPYETTTPVPALVSSDYILANGCIRILGDVRNPCRNIHIDGPEIIGWGLFGVFAEVCRGGGVYGATRIRRCGRDGVRSYGCEDFWIGKGIEITDITPGLGGTAPRLNAYGATATRRATRTTRFTSFDNFSTGWTLTNVSVGSLVGGSASGAFLQKITPDESTTSKSFRQDITASPNQVWTLSIEAKADGYNGLRLTMFEGSSSDGIRAHFDLSTGTVVTSGVLSSGGSVLSTAVEDLGNGIYRCILRGTVKSSGTVVRGIFQILDSVAAGLTAGAGFAGDGTSGVLMGEAQLVEGDRNWFARARRQNPPSRRVYMIGGTVRGVRTWKPLDTHGGEDIFFNGWKLVNCCFGVGIDEGDTSTAEDSPPRNIYIDNIDADRGSGSGAGELGGGFINAASSSADNLGSNVNIGPNCKGTGFGLDNRGAITLAFIDDFAVNNPQVINSLRPALWVHVGPVSGAARLRARNVTDGPAMIVVNATKANVLLEGGRLRQSSGLGSKPAFSINTQESGFAVQTVSGAWKLENAVTS